MFWPITNDYADPFESLSGLQREMNRLFESANKDTFPSVNVYRKENEVLLTAELPGMQPADINVSVQGDTIQIEGERKKETPPDLKTWHRRERGSGKFLRAFRLPYDVDALKISAKYKNGVLYMSMPRAEASKPKKIAVAAE
ncbi:MAG: hypothetical protein A2020_04385 [Lentisphaerae bacterium GWF2_45_14]|nr:MAG: hypothetical protein A2020_04385 [Lentisphaerae bacterium GWF2_45_14]